MSERTHEIDGKSLSLTILEERVLGHLLLNTGKVVSKADLIDTLYPREDEQPESNVIEVMVSRLRKKIASAGAAVKITTYRARGYRLEPMAQAGNGEQGEAGERGTCGTSS